MEGLRAPMMEHRALAAPTPDPAPAPCTGRARLFALAALLLVTPLAAAATYNVTPLTYNWLPTVGHTALTTWDGSVGCPNTSGDDSLSQSLPIGFTFKFGTTSYTQLRIFSNGRVQFNNTRCSFGTNAVGPPRTYIDPMPANNLANTLRIYGADLDASTAGGGTITYATVGTAPNRTFVVSWNGVPQWSTTGQTAYNLQVQLYENGARVRADRCGASAQAWGEADRAGAVVRQADREHRVGRGLADRHASLKRRLGSGQRQQPAEAHPGQRARLHHHRRQQRHLNGRFRHPGDR
ncbi:MAG: hypothetical protein NTZ79_15325 [Proteobacteria bacterium]|nr:hypothetical protein [Pseudomonadota bacterium]